MLVLAVQGRLLAEGGRDAAAGSRTIERENDGLRRTKLGVYVRAGQLAPDFVCLALAALLVALGMMLRRTRCGQGTSARPRPYRLTSRVVKRSKRVAVIGVGILGASVGWNLSRHGTEVVFIDAGQPGEGVTNWSFSWVNASTKSDHRSYFDLNVAGIAAYRELAETIGPDSWWYPSGHLSWADDPLAEAKLVETAELLAAWDYRAEVWTGAEVRRRLEPAVLVPDQASVVFCPGEAWVHGRHLVARLVDRGIEYGAERRSGVAVCDVDVGADGSIRAVALSDGSSLDVDVVVNAAGPFASRVARLIGRDLPMRREPGVITRIACAQVPVRRPMHAPHIEIRPDGDGSVVLHSREADALIDTGKDLAELARLLQEAARHVVPELGNSRITQTQVADRPIPGDGFPSVGAVPSVPGYYEAVCHSGITLGPVIGRLLASEILSGRTDGMLADFRPDRFPQPERRDSAPQ